MYIFSLVTNCYLPIYTDLLLLLLLYFMYRVYLVLRGASRSYIDRSVSPDDDGYVFCLQHSLQSL